MGCVRSFSPPLIVTELLLHVYSYNIWGLDSGPVSCYSSVVTVSTFTTVTVQNRLQ
jgi:hypothetical protein